MTKDTTWGFSKQPNKLGFVNNPDWTGQATPTHSPCGYWHDNQITVPTRIFFYEYHSSTPRIVEVSNRGIEATLPLINPEDSNVGNDSALDQNTGYGYWPVRGTGSSHYGILEIDLNSLTQVRKIATTDPPYSVAIDQGRGLLYYLRWNDSASIPVRIWKVDIATGLEVAYVEGPANQAPGRLGIDTTSQLLFCSAFQYLYKFSLNPFAYVTRASASLYENGVAVSPSGEVFTKEGSIGTSYIRKWDPTSLAVLATSGTFPDTDHNGGIVYDTSDNVVYAYGTWHLARWDTVTPILSVNISISSSLMTNGGLAIEQDTGEFFIGFRSPLATTNYVTVVKPMEGFTFLYLLGRNSSFAAIAYKQSLTIGQANSLNPVWPLEKNDSWKTI